MASPAPRDRFNAAMRAYSPAQMAIAATLAIGVALGALFLYQQLTAPAYGVLYSNLSEADTAKVVEQLDATGVPYELAAGGTTVLVEQSQVDAARIELAGQGLPANSVVGYELLDAQGLTTSSFREQVNYQRALEGELARTLMSMDEIESAQVRLVLPAERLFTTDQLPATAAVQLVTVAPLTDDQVQAIVHLVASSVPGLEPKYVTVTDASGQLLAGGDSTGAEASTKARFEIESRLINSADSMLASVFGPGQAVVRVSADVSRDELREQSEIFDPDRVAVGSETSSTETYESTSEEFSDAVTTAPPAGTATATSSTTYGSESTATENKVSRTVTETMTPPGTVDRLTVAVAVNESVAATPAQIEELVANAVGLDPARGDEIVVTKIAFTEPVVPDPLPAPESSILDLLPAIIGGLLLVLVTLFSLLRLRSRRIPIDPAELGAAAAPPPPEAGRGERRGARSDAEMLLERVDASPQEAANVLRGWLAEDATESR